MPKLFSSSRSQEKVEMEASGGKPERKLSKKEMKSKSLSLPPGAVLMTHTGDGFFTKIRKCLRMKSKGKYNFKSHPSPGRESDGGSPVSLRSRGSKGTGSPINEHSDQSLLRPNSSPVKITRRSQSDKEEVLLVRSDKRSSGGVHVETRESAGSKEEVLVVTIEDANGGDEDESATGACASGLSPGSEPKDILEDTELDPDYESLDEVRRKVRSTVYAQEGEGNSDGDLKNQAKQPLLGKAKANGDLNGRDSGFDNDSPFTGSPGSMKDSHMPHFSSSVPNPSALHTHRVPTLVVVNGAITLSTDPPPPPSNNDPMVTSSASLNCSSQTLEEDDLYSNAKVIIRKKSQKMSDSNSCSMLLLLSSLLFGGGGGLFVYSCFLCNCIHSH